MSGAAAMGNVVAFGSSSLAGAGWTGATLPPRPALVRNLPPSAASLLRDLAGAAQRSGVAPWDLTRWHFNHPALAVFFGELFAEVRDGRGFAIIGNIPVDLPLPTVKLLWWGIGTFFGRGQSQSNLGDRIGEVLDVTDSDPGARGYRSRKELHLHTDICDMIALLAVRQARSGGETSLASAHAVHALLRARHPDLLARLEQGYHYHRRGEEAPTEAPITPHKVPVFSRAEGVLSLRFVRPYMEQALRADGRSDPDLIAAFDALEATAEEVKTTFLLQPGEAVVVNNLTTLHARAAFEDWPEPARKRLLLRLWLNATGFRPQRLELNVYGSGDGIPFVAGRTSSWVGWS